MAVDAYAFRKASMLTVRSLRLCAAGAGQPAGELDPRVQAELVEHVRHMRLHGSLGEKEPGRDLVVAHVVCDQARDLQLPLRKWRLSFGFDRNRPRRQLLFRREGHCIIDRHREAALVNDVKLPLVHLSEHECRRPVVLLAESLLKLERARSPHTLGTAEERGSALMRAAFRCPPSKSFRSE